MEDPSQTVVIIVAVAVDTMVVDLMKGFPEVVPDILERCFLDEC